MIRMRWLPLALLVTATAATATLTPDDLVFTYHWAPSALIGDDGAPLAPPVHYEVWLQADEAAPTLVATVADDTTYTLQIDAGVSYRLRVCAVDSLDRCSEPSEWSDPLHIPRTVDTPDAATAAALSPAFPNPFNPSTTLRYAVPAGLPAGAPIRLSIHDARGLRVRDLEVERQAGWHDVTWHGRDQQGRPVASGTYLARYVCGQQQVVTRLTMVK